MGKEIHFLKIDEPEIFNADLPGKQASVSHELSLVNSQEKKVAVSSLYPKAEGGYYSFYWHTNLSPKELTSLVEECLNYYENNYGKGVETTGAETMSPFIKDRKRKINKRGLVVFFKKDGETERDELPLPKRPFKWEKIVKKTGSDKISFARLNTPIGDFCIQPARNEIGNFGVISDIKNMEGFAELLMKTTSTTIAKDLVDELLINTVQLLEEPALYIAEQTEEK